MLFFLSAALLLGLSSAANVICTGYGQDSAIPEGPEKPKAPQYPRGYYEQPIPQGCTVGGWRPNFRIRDGGSSRCKPGWKEFERHCYKPLGLDLAEKKRLSFRQNEEVCNRDNAHLYVPNTWKEHKKIHWGLGWNRRDVDGYLWAGLFCARRFGAKNLPLGDMYAVTGEDMRKTEVKDKRGRFGDGIFPGNDLRKCYMYVTQDGRNDWQDCKCDQKGNIIKAMCEAPLRR